MARRRVATKRVIPPDQKYGSELVSKFINCVMERGKKSVAQTIVYKAIEAGAKRVAETQDQLEFFLKALENVKPILEVKSRRVGGANYQVPVEVRPERRVSLAMRWIIQAARSRGEKTMAERLANELFDAFNNTGIAVKKKEDTHRMAEANKAFAHYRW
ncbi:MAG: 30S ribosomal protein S7 [Candidatus Hydrogenedentota bacterium]|jgi:small subunit ribosomal protein S7|uniref:Small ribosomal subunit protein uS7 n=1 Tax=Sumerlaea chitinivorans TaxID=2250252 RepID=A0A2Z4Y701_SUMC1|nr:SSU ribosomal protein S7p (S5e) [Candidatus Sumerlaea chitinivorans]MCX7964193.1 30S ribosomal protein S7 [Candidatus Sumerlaea chitinivorans]RMH28520.1 MAG: 30S ribosomal protein S7 [Candidatus Hydrogenedentota bacterium]GIX44929.1 MAG: 30S ribosomal protein S7 [Candidatus Sumerlaea sp.]